MKKYIPIIIVFVLIIGCQVGYWWVLDLKFVEAESKGLFGDSFGALTSMFSGLAFAGMIYAIILQSRELSLQRTELRLTREEQKNSADAQKELVQQQIKASIVNGLASIVQGRYQYAAALGMSSHRRLPHLAAVERELVDLIEDISAGTVTLELKAYMNNGAD